MLPGELPFQLTAGEVSLFRLMPNVSAVGVVTSLTETLACANAAAAKSHAVASRQARGKEEEVIRIGLRRRF